MNLNSSQSVFKSPTLRQTNNLEFFNLSCVMTQFPSSKFRKPQSGPASSPIPNLPRGAGEPAKAAQLVASRHGEQEEVEAEQEQEEAQIQRRPGAGPRLRPRLGATRAATTGSLGGRRRRLPAGPGYARGRRAV